MTNHRPQAIIRPVHILIDTREQTPYRFDPPRYNVSTASAALPAGDYSLPGFEARVAVERKTLEDLVACLKGKNRERFERELARGRPYDLFVVVVEASMADVAQGRYRSDMKPHAVLQSLFAFQVRYGVAFLWAGDRAGGEYATHSLLAKYLYEIDQRVRTARRGQSQPQAATKD